ncbi:MAG TPA: hypothetical protein PKX79_02405 [Spirochaetota bacterium]|jgi:hypothetical protein|nr:hypothetical protein [Spirochaetota bacterium]OQA98446.1 MAG: hypothetical protein BWY23_01064 [Spirochaetes bacterium ADurb.Bin218]HOK01490.1 hypothetical protein [Spirochaetota bacterium]HOK92118.1 hypothetical protein [Spirochaetota bacterium]HON16838.1 hypothetical protein [Spirochaetota bacterium]
MKSKDDINYYVEPVEIEIYLKKAGIVRTIIKDLKIELIDVEPHNEKSKEIFDFFKSINEPIDLMEVQNNFPQYIRSIYESYYKNMELYEKLSMHFKSGLSGINEAWRNALYLTELLHKYEPTVASTEILGNFTTYNLNYIIRKLNSLGENFLLEDSTVRYLIKRRNEAYKDRPRNREFEKLVELWEYSVKQRN